MANENACRSVFAGFLFRANAPRRLVCVRGGPRPRRLILDEPTNHLNLDPIEAIEAGLMVYPGALVMVSNDERFLGNIGMNRRLNLADLAADDERTLQTSRPEQFMFRIALA
ncbi:hypothetical protein [Rhizobium gallicum]|uniref:hypothetical protein n=1 Tax=Rhizobium gallicum TaxID=56730 RepID=UPI001EF7E290|nr:hypothetical protein [Rhizobium gallicum]ULJ75504.1 hypothetical protein L2W42_35580 [Rhizobium gallicum]